METNNKLREALDDIGNAATWVRDNCYDTTNQTQNYMEDIIAKVHAALAEPVRNYEVGTMEELYGRYEKFCRSHYNCDSDDCTKCPFSQPTCKFAWAQMPYEEGGAK